ncbi:hypothetical protein EDD29_5292 [Actinocorallia herbida]|uniref:Uncharacterized protein n=1 Tax=Actinocorallia herbida TaxID=58109 RepID=A0A3N1D2A1_9ACTN|nr:hypothetical protein [Actinocorallia herbida]ROO87667.1 hypothetical protein EDD29_5292 [Actinocorallia herbida]
MDTPGSPDPDDVGEEYVSDGTENRVVVDTERRARNYDTWCETQKSCYVKTTRFAHEMKINITYGGTGSGAPKGKLDLIWRQSFNGLYSRYQTALKLDGASSTWLYDTSWRIGLAQRNPPYAATEFANLTRYPAPGVWINSQKMVWIPS